MHSKKMPLRKCVACNSMIEKNDLFRIVRNESGIFLDKSYKMQGRGAYVCKKKECLDKAIKKKAFNRSLKQAISEELFDCLYMELENDR